MRIILVFLLLICAADIAYASCGSATCPLDNHHYLMAGRIHFMIAYEYIDQNRIFVGASPSFVGALPNRHDEVQTINQRTIFDLQYGISDAIAVSVEIPFIHRAHSHIAEGKSELFDFSGFGDFVVSGQYALLLPSEEFAPYLSLQIGAKLPTGATGAKSTEGEEAEVTIQPGTGSLDGVLAVNYRQGLFSAPMLSGEYSLLPLIAGVSYQATGNGTNGYRMGNTLLISLGTQYQLTGQVGVGLQMNTMFRSRADVGSTGELPQNTGGTWIFVSPGLRFSPTEGLSAFGYVQLPVYINVHGIQQASNFNLQFGVSADLDLL